MTNGVMLQTFTYFSQKDDPVHGRRSLWTFLRDEAPALANAGFTAVWLPPMSKGSGNDFSTGYDIYDHFDLGEFSRNGAPERTKYGSKEQLASAVKALRHHGVQVYADIVLNHMNGGAVDDYWQAVRVETHDRRQERWGEGYERGMIEVRAYCRFDHSHRGGRYSSFQWRSKHFDAVDTVDVIRQDGVEFKDGRPYLYRFVFNEPGYQPSGKTLDDSVSSEKGNYDYLMSSDLDFGRYDVREHLKYWGEWLTEELGLDGYRFDAVKHIPSWYVREWLGHVRQHAARPLFAVAEYYATGSDYRHEVERLHRYLDQVTAGGPFPQDLSLFDFTLRNKWHGLSWTWGPDRDLRSLERDTLFSEQPMKAVTFIENHDFEYGRNLNSHVQHWVKPMAYAYILLRANGYPCVFSGDYFGTTEDGSNNHEAYPSGREYLDLLLALRRQFALGEERFYGGSKVAGWVRMGFVPGAKGAMAVVMNVGDSAGHVWMGTGRTNRRFYHLATLKYRNGQYEVVRGRYELYGDKADGLTTNEHGWGAFLADGESASIWLEDGVGLN